MMISAVSTGDLPAINGNSLFWVMTALIAGLSVAVMRLSGALYRSRHVPAVIQADPQALEAFAAAAPLQGRAPRTPARRRFGIGRLLAAAGILAAVLWAADKVLHFRLHGAAGTASPAPAVPAAPRPAPVATHPAPKVPPATVKAGENWLESAFRTVASAAHSVLAALTPVQLAIAVLAVLAVLALVLRRRRPRLRVR
jgi:hypothetical protein